MFERNPDTLANFLDSKVAYHQQIGITTQL